MRFLAVPDWADDAGLRTLVRAYVDGVAPGAAAELALAVDVEAVPVDDAFGRVATILASVAGADGETADVVLEPWRRADPLPVTPRTLLIEQLHGKPGSLPGLLRCPPEASAFAWAVHHVRTPSPARWE